MSSANSNPFDITSVTVSGIAGIGGSGGGSISLVPSTPPPPPPPPELPCNSVGGHRVGSTVRYVDGLVVGRCERCDDRVMIRVAGGAHVPEAESLASAALDMAREGRAAEALALLEIFGVTLAEDSDALTEALSIFLTVKRGISRILRQEEG